MKKVIIMILAITTLLLCACSDIKTDDEVSLCYDISELFVDCAFWSPPSVGDGNNPNADPVFSLIMEKEVLAGDESFKCVIVEQNDKNICTYSYLYLLEKKNGFGEWEPVGYAPEFFERNYGDICAVDFFDASVETSPKETRQSLTVYAKHHGVESFAAGEYRITRKVSCKVGEESVCETLSLEFRIK